MRELKQKAWEANLELSNKGLVVLTWGNVSAYDADTGLVAIKPSGVPYDLLRPDDIVVVDIEGRRVDGRLNPSSDLPTHLELYRSFGGIGGVAHTHSTWATAWAQARMPVPVGGTTHADHFYGKVPCTRDMTREEIASDYELNTGRVIVELFDGTDPLLTPGVLVSDHGPFTWGRDAREAVENSIVLEEIAKMALLSHLLSPGAPMNSGLTEKHFERKHGKGAYYGQDK